MTNASLLYDKQLLVLIHMNIKRKRVNSSGARSRQVPAPRRMATPKGRIPGVAQRTGSRQALAVSSCSANQAVLAVLLTYSSTSKFWVASQKARASSHDETLTTAVLYTRARVSFIVLFAFLRFALCCSDDGDRCCCCYVVGNKHAVGFGIIPT